MSLSLSLSLIVRLSMSEAAAASLILTARWYMKGHIPVRCMAALATRPSLPKISLEVCT